MSTQSLKPGWKMVSFGEVVKNANFVERNPEANGVERIVGLEHIDPENLYIRRWNSVEDGTSFTRRFVPGQTLFGKRRAYQRKVAYVEFGGICSGDILTFEPKNKKVLLSELLPFICQSDAFFDHAVDTSAGSLSPRTSWKALKEFQFPLPPLHEQKRIAEILWAADGAVRAYECVKVNGELVAKTLFLQHMQNAEETIEVGKIARFTSGKSIKVTELPNTPSDEFCIPVYGGNGISGYTKSVLSDYPGSTVIIGRVGQFCGNVLVSRDAGWITDNALYAKWLSPDVLVDYLALALRYLELNKNKIGNYLPLINQKVVHGARIPKVPVSVQERLTRVHRKVLDSIECSIAVSEELLVVRKAFMEGQFGAVEGATDNVV